MKKTKIIGILILILIIFFSINILKSKTKNVEKNNICNERQLLTVSGTSMDPVIKNGQDLIFMPNYYNCNEIKRGDIIIYHFSGNKNPLVKRIVSIPGDKFEYNGSNIFINGEILKNSSGQDYKISSKMLKYYAGASPILPKDAYLILGEKVSGTKDSSKFGFIDKSDVIGRVVLDNF